MFHMRFVFLVMATATILSSSTSGGESGNSIEDRMDKLEKLMVEVVAIMGSLKSHLAHVEETQDIANGIIVNKFAKLSKARRFQKLNKQYKINKQASSGPAKASKMISREQKKRAKSR